MKEKLSINDLFDKDYTFFYIMVVIAGLFAYGKYFVAITELEKMNYGLIASLSIILGFVITIMIRIERLIKIIKGGNDNE